MKTARLTSWDLVYATSMAIACFISYWIMTHTLYRLVDKPSALLGGMWAAVATIFVYRETSGHSLSAGIARLIATSISFALCLLYLLFFPFTAVGMAVLIGIGTAVLALLGRRSEFVTTAITTAVVMVVAALSPENAWHQPLLRLVDTVVGIAVGVAGQWVGSALFSMLAGERKGCPHPGSTHGYPSVRPRQ